MARRLLVLASLCLASAYAAEPQIGKFISLPAKENATDLFVRTEIELPAGKIVRAWTAIDAVHDYILYINGQEASRSRMGRFASSWRRCQEIEDLAKYLNPGKNVLAMKVHRWSVGKSETPEPRVFLRSEVQIETGQGLTAVPVATDASWVGSHEAPANWTAARSNAAGWQPVMTGDFPQQSPRLYERRGFWNTLRPDIPAPLLPPALAAFPQIAEMSDWQQQVVFRDPKAEAERLMAIFQTQFVADRYAEAISHPNAHMGDSYSISAYPVGNGWVWTAVGPYPFYNCIGVVGPEYQYPAQWNAGTAFCGDQVDITADGKPLDLRNQWQWKIRKADVVVTAAADPSGKAVFYTLTLAPPKLKALVRIYTMANASDAPLKSVVVTNSISRTKVAGKQLTESVKHTPIADAKGDANVRTMIAGVLEEDRVTASADEKEKRGRFTISLGDVAPGECKKVLLYRVTYLEEVNGKRVPSDAEATLAAVKEKSYKLLDETVQFWRDYSDRTTSLEAPGPWGRRVADFIDDVKVLVQTQQFERTGAVGPMWFFSDQWIRDACGPMKSFTRTGRFDNAKRVLDYHFLASAACGKILNWLPMDVDIASAKPVEDWSKITVNYADRHANSEVPSWLILQHHWYYRFSGDTKTIANHWDYLKRCYYGQFDNPTDKISRPDFKIPFHGDETYIYSGGEGLWENRYDLQQSSYPGGNIYSADSSFELVAAGDALVEMAKAIGKADDATAIAAKNREIREATEKYYWMPDLGFYAQGMSVLFDGQLNRFPMANILANVLWCNYLPPSDPKAVSNALRMTEYLAEASGVFNPILGYDVTVGMLQGQCLYSLAAINHPWAEKAFHALLMLAGDTTEFTEWMAVCPDFRVGYRANRIRPWEAGINLDALLYYLSGFEPNAAEKKLTLTPRLPTGRYSPIKWDSITLKHLPMGDGAFDLSVAGYPQQLAFHHGRSYKVTSRSKDDVAVTLNIVLPSARIGQVWVNGKEARVRKSEVFSQAFATVETPLPAGKTLEVSVAYQEWPGKPVEVELKDFKPTEPEFGKSEIVVFTQLKPQPKRTLLHEELAKRHKVAPIDATLPTDPATFRAALLSGRRLRTQLLILDEGTMGSGTRKPTFWWDPEFDRLIGEFLAAGGVVVEVNTRNPSSRWIERTLAPARFEADYTRGGDILAMDAPDGKLDDACRWIDEKEALACGKWSAYWEGWYAMPYIGGSQIVRDHATVWGTQEQPHGCMQFTMKTVPGKDHLIRLRTWPRPKHGFTLQVTDDGGKTWNQIEEVWVPTPEDPKVNGWVDAYLTLPGKYATGDKTVFRIGCPKGSAGGIGNAGYDSTGASRIWVRDSLERPPSLAQLNVRSALAAKLGLPAEGYVAASGGRIAFQGFACPYRIAGDSAKGALILRPVGRGLYVKTELTSLFSTEQMAAFVETLLDPAKRRAALAGVRIGE